MKHLWILAVVFFIAPSYVLADAKDDAEAAEMAAYSAGSSAEFYKDWLTQLIDDANYAKAYAGAYYNVTYQTATGSTNPFIEADILFADIDRNQAVSEYDAAMINWNGGGTRYGNGWTEYNNGNFVAAKAEWDQATQDFGWAEGDFIDGMIPADDAYNGYTTVISNMETTVQDLQDEADLFWGYADGEKSWSELANADYDTAKADVITSRNNASGYYFLFWKPIFGQNANYETGFTTALQEINGTITDKDTTANPLYLQGNIDYAAGNVLYSQGQYAAAKGKYNDAWGNYYVAANFWDAGTTMSQSIDSDMDDLYASMWWDVFQWNQNNN